MIYNATLVSEAGRGVLTGLKLWQHLQKVLKAYLNCFAVLSALDVIQYRGSSDASSSIRWSLLSLLMPIHLPSSNISEKCVCSNKTSISSYFQITTFLVYQNLHLCNIPSDVSGPLYICNTSTVRIRHIY